MEKEDFDCTARFCKNGDLKKCDKEVKGKWELLEKSMFVVELENGQRFITSMRYEILPEIAADPTALSVKELKKKIHSWEKGHKDDKDALPY